MAQLPFLVLLLVNHCIIQYVYYNDSSEMQQQIVVAVETQYQHQQRLQYLAGFAFLLVEHVKQVAKFTGQTELPFTQVTEQ